MTKEELIAFETEVADAFNAGRIRAPIHLSGGNEDDLIRIFENVGPDDWVASNWRSHYHCLLKGVPPEKLMADILAGKSITLCYPEHRVFSSAIVGGALPIAVGIALGIKRRGGAERVWAFCGDMTEWTGMFHECWEYANGHDLPIKFIVERNGVSVCTDTEKSWTDKDGRTRYDTTYEFYEYKLPYPHSGAGVRVNF